MRLVRAFVAVARHGSVSAAARELGYSQPAVTVQLRELERLVGQKLFARGATPLRLTSAGRDRLVAAELMLLLESRLVDGTASDAEVAAVGDRR